MFSNPSVIVEQNASIPDHVKLALILSLMAVSLFLRFELNGNIADCEQSIEYFRTALELTPESHPMYLPQLCNLGGLLFRRYERFGNIFDCEESIERLRTVVVLTPDYQSFKPAALSSLGSCLSRRFERLGEASDCDESILCLRQAVALTLDDNSSKLTLLSNLGTSLFMRYEKFGNVTDLDESIVCIQTAFNLTPIGEPEDPLLFDSLGISLLRRFERSGDIIDCNRSIKCHQNAAKLIYEHHPDKHVTWNNLASSLLGRFEQLGNIEDCDESIRCLRKAIASIPDNHPSKPTLYSSLGNSLSRRFERLENITDYNESILCRRTADNLTPEDHLDKASRLLNLGISSLSRFKRFKIASDFEESIGCFENALGLVQDNSPKLPALLSNLGDSYSTRFEQLGIDSDCVDAIAFLETAVNLTPDGHPEKPRRLNHLGSLHLREFSRSGDVASCYGAIICFQTAVKLTPDGHAAKPSFLNGLGASYECRYRKLSRIIDGQSAISEFSTAAKSSWGPPKDRLNAARRWAELSSLIGASPLEAYTYAMNLLPLVAWLGLPMVARHSQLAEIGQLPSEAAAAAISWGEHEKALEWREQGNSVVWTQILHLRTPLDMLRQQDHALADQLEALSRRLGRGDDHVMLNGKDSLSLEEAARKHRELTAEWERTVEKVREIPGFEDFLRAKRTSQLRFAARDGPVIVLNAHKSRCDALVLLPELEDIIHIRLDGISLEGLIELQQRLSAQLIKDGRGQSIGMRAHRQDDIDGQHPNDYFKHLLSELWRKVVKPVLDRLAFPVQPGNLQRVWWCATGPLAFLPIHAAGLYDTDHDEPGSKLSDYVISSYTPTLNAILDQFTTTNNRPFTLASVSQVDTSLPGTATELNVIQSHLGKLPHTSLQASGATVERVVEEMKKCSWLHLACHGNQRTDDPTKSAFLLHGGELELSEIIKLSLPHAAFAYLSACQTSKGDEKIPEEAVHLAAGMLLAGYPSVIGTMWSIDDAYGPIVADKVYAKLLKDHQPNSSLAAEALHEAVQKLRKEHNASFLSWVPFVHIGR